jgi:hypothetical protein
MVGSSGELRNVAAFARRNLVTVLGFGGEQEFSPEAAGLDLRPR